MTKDTVNEKLTDLWILQMAFPTVTSCLFPVSRKAPLMVSMVFPDFGPNNGKISVITGSWRQRPPGTLTKSISCLDTASWCTSFTCK